MKKVKWIFTFTFEKRIIIIITHLEVLQSLISSSKSVSAISLHLLTPGCIEPSPRRTRTCSTLQTRGFIPSLLHFVYTVWRPPTRFFRNISNACGDITLFCHGCWRKQFFLRESLQFCRHLLLGHWDWPFAETGVCCSGCQTLGSQEGSLRV